MQITKNVIEISKLNDKLVKVKVDNNEILYYYKVTQLNFDDVLLLTKLMNTKVVSITEDDIDYIVVYISNTNKLNNKLNNGEIMTDVTKELTVLMSLDATLYEARLLSSVIALSYETELLTTNDYELIDKLVDELDVYVDEYVENNTNYTIIYIDIEDISSCREFCITDTINTLNTCDCDAIESICVYSDKISHRLNIQYKYSFN